MVWKRLKTSLGGELGEAGLFEMKQVNHHRDKSSGRESAADTTAAVPA